MKRHHPTRMTSTKLQRLLDKTLAAMIDEWYENVSSYYSTDTTQKPVGEESELKRFHDEKGHRIKFSKDALQCTYGLRVLMDESENRIEISVNNKVEDFDYGEFLNRLDRHYRPGSTSTKGGSKTSSVPPSAAIFLLESDFRQAFSVERSEGKADVVRLSFHVDPEGIEALSEEPEKLRASIEEYCLSPLRRIYAELYRRSTRRR